MTDEIKRLSDGSSRHKLVGGPYDRMAVRVYDLEPIPFPAFRGRPAALYVWRDATVGKGKNIRIVKAFAHQGEQ